MARFAHEARTLAALNHPRIAQIYGFETSGAAPALVMELVDGPTLADRLVRGALPPDEALPSRARSPTSSARRTTRASCTAI